MSYHDFRNKPLEKGKMSIKKFRGRLKNANGIREVDDVLKQFLTQFSHLHLLWLKTEIQYILKSIPKKQSSIDDHI